MQICDQEALSSSKELLSLPFSVGERTTSCVGKAGPRTDRLSGEEAVLRTRVFCSAGLRGEGEQTGSRGGAVKKATRGKDRVRPGPGALRCRHPLFPLLALLFEKCEQATQGSECITSASFDVDIENFVHQQEQDHKPFFSEDPELDNLVGVLGVIGCEVTRREPSGGGCRASQSHRHGVLLE
ncbi:hypothetical protein Z043_104733 [Scleropages formosus]|uniref:MEIS N-terminal domain-containing protein n=1 Tax=Scleropages formosus TaxID=113540 RepID=A0A0P7VQZ7_SCLFO|nr:hypothetical protein Z043_104733 [Scleropages formosus]